MIREVSQIEGLVLFIVIILIIGDIELYLIEFYPESL